MIQLIKKAWEFREFIIGNVKREFQSKYQNSILGAAWIVINPMAMITIYTVIFSEIMRSKLPGVDGNFAYSIYLCSGILTWGLFSEIVTRSQSMFIDNANLIKKLNFPKLCLPIIVTLNSMLNFSIVFGLFLLFLIVSGNFPGWVFLYIIPVLGIQLIFSIGLGIALGVLNVFFRDVGQFFGIFIQFWFWLTPVVYSVINIPYAVRYWIAFNPMTSIISSYQAILVLGKAPDWNGLFYTLIFGVLIFLMAIRFFRNNVGEMVDEL
jgi:lipopolysaccharide transport system permease protein